MFYPRSDTCSFALRNAIIAPALYSKMRKHVSEELCRVLGTERAPETDDIPNFPYVVALIEDVGDHKRHLFDHQRYISPGQQVRSCCSARSMTEDTVPDSVPYPRDATIFINQCLSILIPLLADDCSYMCSLDM